MERHADRYREAERAGWMAQVTIRTGDAEVDGRRQARRGEARMVERLQEQAVQALSIAGQVRRGPG